MAKRRKKKNNDTSRRPLSQNPNVIIEEHPTMEEKGRLNINTDWTFLGDEDPNAKLRGQSGIKFFRNVRLTDTSVASTLLILESILQKLDYTITGHEGQDEIVEDLIDQRDNLRTGFTNWIRLAAGAFQYGHSVFERIWGVDEKGFRIIDLAHRKQSTITRWYQNEDGRLWGIGQSIDKLTVSGTEKNGAPKFKIEREIVAIPVEGYKLMVITFLGDGSNPRGVSALRPTYFHTKYKKELYKLDAIFADRLAVPTPIISIPDAKFQAEKAQALAMLKVWRSHEQGGMVKKDSWTVEFSNKEKHNNDPIMKSLEHQDRRIKEALLQGILSLGEAKFGSKGVGSELNKLLMMSLQAIADFIAEAYTEDVIKATVIARYGPTKDNKYPWMEATGIESEDIKAMIDGIASMVDKNVVIVDKPVREHARGMLGLPEESDEAEEIANEKRDMATKMLNAPPPGAATIPPGQTPPPTKDDDKNKPEKNIAMHKLIPYTERRKPRASETHIDFNNISTNLTNFEAQMNGILQKFKNGMLEWVAKETKAGDGDVSEKKRPPGFSALRRQMNESSLDSFHFGAREYNTEIKRLVREDRLEAAIAHHAVPKKEPFEKDVLKNLRNNLNTRLDEWMSFYYGSSKRAWTTIKDKNIHGALKLNEMLPELMDELRGLSDRSGEELVRALTSISNGEGRMSASRKNKKQAPKVMRSAIFDYNLCENCAPHDGMIYGVGDTRAIVPDPNCEGGRGRCRCFIAPAGEQK